MSTKIKGTSNKIIYSSFRSHNSTTEKVEKTLNSFSNQLFESNTYFEIIDDFYDSLKNYQEKMSKNKQKSNIFYVEIIIQFIKTYNKNYLNLLNYDSKFSENKHIQISNLIKKFEFNFNQIGITISNRNLLKLDIPMLKQCILKSLTLLDFMFEKNGLFENLQDFFQKEQIESNTIHINTKI
jgi:hypothetical protein